MKVTVKRDGTSFIELTGGGMFGPIESITAMEAETLIKDLRKAIDKVRADNRPTTRLGDF